MQKLQRLNLRNFSKDFRASVIFAPVLRIRDILVWIRFRGSVSLTTVMDPVRHCPSRRQQKLFFLSFLLITVLFEGTLT
jgi:hypothetical protein